VYDTKEILKLVVEHEAVQKLYLINNIDNSLINRMIVEETLNFNNFLRGALVQQGAILKEGDEDTDVDPDPDPVDNPEPIPRNRNTVMNFFAMVENMFPEQQMSSENPELYDKFKNSIVNKIKDALDQPEKIETALRLMGYITPLLKQGKATINATTNADHKKEIRKRYLETVIKTFMEKEVGQSLKDLSAEQDETDSTKYIADNITMAYLSTLGDGYVSLEKTNNGDGPIVRFVNQSMSKTKEFINNPPASSNSIPNNIIKAINAYRDDSASEDQKTRAKSAFDTQFPKLDSAEYITLASNIMTPEINKLGADTKKQLQKMIKKQLKSIEGLTSNPEVSKDEKDFKDKLRRIFDLFKKRVSSYIDYAKQFKVRAEKKYDDLEQREDLKSFINKTIPKAIGDLESKLREIETERIKIDQPINEVRIGDFDTETPNLNTYSHGDVVAFINEFAKELDTENGEDGTVNHIFKQILDMTKNEEVYKRGRSNLIDPEDGAIIDTPENKERLSLDNFLKAFLDNLVAKDSTGLDLAYVDTLLEFTDIVKPSLISSIKSSLRGLTSYIAEASNLDPDELVDKTKEDLTSATKPFLEELILAFLGYKKALWFSKMGDLPNIKMFKLPIKRGLKTKKTQYEIIKFLYTNRRKLSGIQFDIYQKVKNNDIDIAALEKFKEFFKSHGAGSNASTSISELGSGSDEKEFVKNFFLDKLIEPTMPEGVEVGLRPIVQKILENTIERSKYEK